MTKLGSRKLHICPKVTKIGSIIGHRIDHNWVGALRRQRHTPFPEKFTQVSSPGGLKCGRRSRKLECQLAFPWKQQGKRREDKLKLVVERNFQNVVNFMLEMSTLSFIPLICSLYFLPYLFLILITGY